MGGSGSGQRWSKKGVVEGCRSIDTADWKRWKLLVPGTTDRPGSLEWGRGTAGASSISYRITVGARAGALRLIY